MNCRAEELSEKVVESLMIILSIVGDTFDGELDFELKQEPSVVLCSTTSLSGSVE